MDEGSTTAQSKSWSRPISSTGVATTMKMVWPFPLRCAWSTACTIAAERLIYAATGCLSASGSAGTSDWLALGIEHDDVDGLPVPPVARPAPRVALARVLVQLMQRQQDLPVCPGVALGRRHVADATVAVLLVVPTHEASHQLAGLLQVGQASLREFRPVLGRSQQALHEGVVVAHPRTRVGRAPPT